MTITQSPWVVIGVLSLALFGAWFLATKARDWIRGAAGWLADWMHGRIDPPWWWKPWLYRHGEEYDDEPCHECAGPWECPRETWCYAKDDDQLEQLPPERSREELGFTAPQQVVRKRMDLPYPWLGEEARERRAPWWEAEHRAAYVAMGFEYPSGLMARVREAAP